MAGRRILSLWFPRLAADRIARRRGDVVPTPLAVVGDRNGAQVLVSLSVEAEGAGLALGQPLRDATAICPNLLTLPADPPGEAQFLLTLRRWAGRFSPWVAQEPPAGLMIDLTGSAHLYGGEEGVLARVAEDCEGLGLAVRAGIADTPGAAWALARYSRSGGAPCGPAMRLIKRRGRPGRARPSAGVGNAAAARPARSRRGGPKRR